MGKYISWSENMSGTGHVGEMIMGQNNIKTEYEEMQGECWPRSLLRLTEAEGRCSHEATRVGTLIVATIYLQLIQNRFMFRSFTVLQCSHQHCVQPVASDEEVVGYL